MVVRSLRITPDIVVHRQVWIVDLEFDGSGHQSIIFFAVRIRVSCEGTLRNLFLILGPILIVHGPQYDEFGGNGII